jgi:hypothetical protein
MQKQKQMRGFFAALRMTSSFWSGFGSRTSKGKGKGNDNGKSKNKCGGSSLRSE